VGAEGTTGVSPIKGPAEKGKRGGKKRGRGGGGKRGGNKKREKCDQRAVHFD